MLTLLRGRSCRQLSYAAWYTVVCASNSRLHFFEGPNAEALALKDGRGKRHSSGVSACFKCRLIILSKSSFKKSACAHVYVVIDDGHIT